MSGIKLILGFYHSVPVGENTKTIESLYQQFFKPFLTALYQASNIKVTLYYCGSLLEWFEQKHPEVCTVLNEMLKRKQIEFLTGPYYEAFLPMIPVTDRIGQIEMLTNYLWKLFGKRSHGCWLPENVWEPQLVSNLKTSGILYTFFDEFQFLSNHWAQEDLLQPFLTEDLGNCCTVFPVLTSYSQPSCLLNPESIYQYGLRHAKNDKQPILTLFFDPMQIIHTPDICKALIQEKGLAHFFDSLNTLYKNQLDITLPSLFLKTSPAYAKAYFPDSAGERFCSSIQNLKNSDRTKAQDGSSPHAKPLDAPGFSRRILLNHPESNLLYSKMIYTNILVHHYKSDKARKKNARMELWRGQNHFPYWSPHILKSHLRKNAYQAMIAAEKVCRQQQQFQPALLPVDFDFDGEQEFLYQGKLYNTHLHKKGAVLFELDYFPACWNYLDTYPLTKKISTKKKQSWQTGKAFADYIYTKQQKNLVKQWVWDAQTDCPDFQLVKIDRENHSVAFNTEKIITIENKKITLTIQKKYSFHAAKIQLDYSVQAVPQIPKLEIVFGTSLHCALRSYYQDPKTVFRIKNAKWETNNKKQNSTIEAAEVKNFSIWDMQNKLELSFEYSEPMELILYPALTIDSALGVQEYCSTAIMAYRNLALQSENPIQWSLTLHLIEKANKKQSEK